VLPVGVTRAEHEIARLRATPRHVQLERLVAEHRHMSAWRTPARLDARTVIFPAVRTMSRHRRSSTSPMAQASEHDPCEHRPPRHVLPVASRGTVELAGGVRQRSNVLGPVVPHGRRPRGLHPPTLPLAGLRSIMLYSTTSSRICAKRVIVLLIDVADSTRSRTFAALYRSTSAIVSCDS
jgi:hypothetical protein